MTGIKAKRVVSGWGGAVVCLATVVIAAVSTASAIPPLQLYIEGATYDSESETWSYQPSSPNTPIRIWTLGNIDGKGGKGAISDVHLAISYAAGAAPDFTLTPGRVDDVDGWVDRNVPDAPTFIRTVTDGSTPTRSDGREISDHDQFGDDRWWQEYDLGFFDETTSSVGDLSDGFGYEDDDDDDGDDDDHHGYDERNRHGGHGGHGEHDGHDDDRNRLGGQINLYEITIENADGLELRFDLYDTIVAEHVTVFYGPFAPDGGVSVIPVPGAALLAIAGLGLVGVMRRKFS